MNAILKLIDTIDDIILAAKLRKYVEQLEEECDRRQSVIKKMETIIQQLSQGREL